MILKRTSYPTLSLYAVDKYQKVEAEVPIRVRYAEGNDSSPAERSSLIVLEQLATVEVRAVPDKLPDALEYDGERLVEIGDQITVADLIVPDEVEVLTEPEHVIATVYEPSALAAANDAAGGQAEAAEAETVPSEEGAAAEGETVEGEPQPTENPENVTAAPNQNPEREIN